MKTSIFLTDRFFAFLISSQLLGFLALVYSPFLVFYLAAIPVFLLACLVDSVTLRGTKKGWTGEIRVLRTPELGEKVPVRVLLYPQAGSAVPRRLRLVPILSERLRFDTNLSTLNAKIDEGRVVFQGELAGKSVRLGYESLSQVRAIATSNFGLFGRLMEVTATSTPFRVIPTKKEISPQSFSRLVVNQRLLYQGTRMAMRGRAAEQFHSVRDYQFPDPIRHIDAKKTAKFGRLMTRTFDSLYSHHLVLALDVGRAMLGGISGSEKQDYYLAACLSLAQNALRSQDRVSLMTFTQRVHYLLRDTRHMGSFVPIFEGREAVQAREEESNFELILPTVQSVVGQRSIVVILTDVSKPSVREALARALPSLCRRHLVVVMSVLDHRFQVDDQVFRLGQDKLPASDYSRLLYSYWQEDEAEVFQKRVSTLPAGVVRIGENEWLSAVVKLYGILRESQSL